MIGNKVLGHGNLRAEVLICGEGPGRTESVEGIPFCGPSGSELDWLFLKRAAKMNREDVYVTNIVKWRTDEDDSDPTPADIERDETELLAEIQVVDPKIIVAVGKVAAQWFMAGQNVDMEKLYGVPIRCPRYPDRLLLVSYHPAAGIRLPEKYYDKIFWTFQQLGRLVRDEYGPVEPVGVAAVYDQPVSGPPPTLVDVAAVDTEGSATSPWGLSVSAFPGVSQVAKVGQPWMDTIRPCLNRWPLVMHNALHDLNVLRSMDIVPAHTPDDSMLMAYLFPWLPRGLKPLMFKLARLEQDEYETIIGPGEEKVATEYLKAVLENKCAKCSGDGTVEVPYKRQPGKTRRVKCDDCGGDGTGWPLPEPQLIFSGDSSARVYKPRSIGRGVRAALERGTRLRESWEAIDEAARNNVESKLGRMREATLDDIDPEVAKDYAARDADGTLRVYHILEPMVRKEGLWNVYQIDKGIIPIIDRMHQNGILIDKAYFADLDKKFAQEQQQATETLSSLVGFSFNPSSPLQVTNLLYDRMGLTPPRGAVGTDEKTLESLKLKYSKREDVAKVIDQITEYRELTKMRGTYAQPLPLYADTNGRVHTRFLLHVTTSGRLSSRDPNLQNVPTRTERGRLIRQGFVAKPGCKLVSVDLDQIELRVAAHLAEDDNMVDIFSSGKDIHRATASLIYGKPLDQITVQERLLSKTINFGILYGMSPKRLMKELNLLGITVTLDQCVGFINDWFNAYPGIREYMDRCHKQARDLGYVECLFGRRRYLPGVYSTLDKIREESLRWSVNHPDQATAAGILKLWLRAIGERVVPTVARFGYCEPLLTVHDEIIFEAEEGLEDLLIGLTVAEAAQSMDLLVPIAAKGSSAYSWDKLK
jgi:uracil-DNA glycosylase family 4